MAGRKTIPHVVAEKQFQRGAPRLVDFLRFALDDHAGHGHGGAGGHEPALAVGHDLDQANQAGGERPALFQMAQGRNVQADLPRRLQDRLARRNLDLLSVNSDGKSRSCHLDRVLRAHLAAGVAPRAFLQVDHVPRRRASSGWRWTGQCWAQSVQPVQSSVTRYLIKRRALAGRAAALQVGLVFVAEIAQRGEHRVGRRLAQAAQAARR